MNNTNQTTSLAASILLGFALIAAAIYFSNTPTSPTSPTLYVGAGGEQVAVTGAGSPKREESPLRRIYGNLEAETTIVEFSDLECSFCARLHPTLKQVVDESEGSVNWEYRHLPLTSHAGARPAAIASECVGDLAGNDAFWSYLDVIFANQRSLTPDFLEAEASQLGIDTEAYQSCLVSDEVAQRVDKDLAVAISLGGSGTPFNVVEFADGTTKVASGALPYANWAQIIGSN
ncbi:MAG: protein-disulfide isomerase [Acidimicrobiales bacterium]|jgi:protein-disulfide isomerase